MARERRTLNVKWMIAVALSFLLVVAFVSFARRDEPSPTPKHMIGDETATRAPASLASVRESLEQTDRALAQGEWDRAEAKARQTKELWLSYRTPMRAGAGRRMWSPASVEEFESALNGMIDDVARRQAAAARGKIGEMIEIIKVYDDQTQVRLDTNREDRGDQEGESPRRAPGEAKEN